MLLKYQNLKQVTGPQFLIYFSPNTKRFYLAFLIPTLLQIAQAIFKSLNRMAQRANSLKEHTSHCCGVQKKKTVYSFCFGALWHGRRGPNQGGVLIGLLKWTIWSRWGWKAADYWRWMAPTEGKSRLHPLVTCQPKDADIVGLSPQWSFI